MRNENKVKKVKSKESQYKGFQIFTLQEEKLLVDYLLTCSIMNYGMIKTVAMKFACEYAQVNSKKQPENQLQNNFTGKD